MCDAKFATPRSAQSEHNVSTQRRALTQHGHAHCRYLEPSGSSCFVSQQPALEPTSRRSMRKTNTDSAPPDCRRARTSARSGLGPGVAGSTVMAVKAKQCAGGRCQAGHDRARNETPQRVHSGAAHTITAKQLGVRALDAEKMVCTGQHSNTCAAAHVQQHMC